MSELLTDLMGVQLAIEAEHNHAQLHFSLVLDMDRVKSGLQFGSITSRIWKILTLIFSSMCRVESVKQSCKFMIPYSDLSNDIQYNNPISRSFFNPSMRREAYY